MARKENLREVETQSGGGVFSYIIPRDPVTGKVDHLKAIVVGAVIVAAIIIGIIMVVR